MLPTLAAWLLLLPAAALAQATSFNPAKVRRLHILAGRGEIRVRGTQPKQARVEVVAGGCAVDSTLLEGTLQVKVPAQCQSADLDVRVPMQVDTTVQMRAGSLFISGVRGSLALELGQVNAVVGGLLTHLRVQGEDGGLSATGLLGDSDIQLVHGNVQLWYDKAARRGLILLHLEEGNVTVALPGRSVAARAKLDAGELHPDLDVVDPSPFTIDGEIRRGSLFIRRTAS